MPQFTDCNQRTWTVAFDGLSLIELRETHKIDLADVLSATYVQLERDPALLTQSLAFLCRHQIKEAGITPGQFSKALIGSHLEQAFAALWGAAEAFFPPKLWSVLSSRCEQEKKASETRQQMKVLGLLEDLPPELRDQLYAEIGKSLPIALPTSTAGEVSASGQASTPPTPA